LIKAAGVALVALLSFFACSTPAPVAQETASEARPEPVAAPGTIEDKSNPLMSKIAAAHEAAKPAADEIVIYYYRADAKYADWGFWLWAAPGGDGGATWSKSSQLKVADGVGYFKCKRDGSDLGVPVISGAGTTGVIARKVDGWTKDGNDDRIIDMSVSNEWVIFSNDGKTYPYGKYQPSIDGARFVARDKILLELSGKHALSVTPADNGFKLATKDGKKTFAVKDVVNNGNQADRNDNYSRRLLVTLASPADITETLYVSHQAYQAPVAVNTAALAVEIANATVPPANHELGAVYDAAAKSVEFRLWAPLATGVDAVLYKASNAKAADASLALKLDPKTGVWSGRFADSDPDGMFYEYMVHSGPAKKVVLDPYAKSMDAFKGSGAGRGAVINPAKALPAGGWEGGDDYKLAKREDAIIYEVSVRDFTIQPEAGVKARPGSYLAFIEKLPYLKGLGVTHIQLMPVMNFYYNDETKTAFEATGTANDNNYNWGYDPHSYFSPEGWFSENPADPYARMVELKTLIKAIHQAGMGVLLDVVYNHTANATILGDIVPGYYYRTNASGGLTSNSGCGNDVATERPMASRLISDSVNYWVSEYKVDGFRFDLMGLIDVNTILKSRERAAANKDKADLLFEGEGWKMYSGPASVKVMDQNYMSKTDQVAVFNDEIRDLLKGGGLDDRAKGFITDKAVNPSLLFKNLIGQPQLNYQPMAVGNNLNYAEAHDNLTMHDNLSLNMNLSDKDAGQRAELAARLRLGNFFILTSQGIAFTHAGQESGRTKPKLNSKSEILGDFVHNSYDAADNINQFDWNPLPEYRALREFTAGMIAIRKANEAFRIGDAAAISAAAKQIEGDGPRSIGWSIAWKGQTWYLFVNSDKAEKRVFDAGTDLAGGAVLVASDQANPAGVAAPKGFTLAGSKITVEPLTAVMIRK
jgi:secreted pullulanase